MRTEITFVPIVPGYCRLADYVEDPSVPPLVHYEPIILHPQVRQLGASSLDNT